MPRKPEVPRVAAPGHVGDKGLAVKDGLREVRFNMKRGARKLVEAVEAATHRHDAQARGPFGLLTEPLNLAVRTTASILSNVDHAAVDVLSSDGPYRSMTVPLRSSAAYFSAAAMAADLRDFTTDHHWRYRHWLAQKQIGDVFVHEQAIAWAGAQVAADVGDASTAAAPQPAVVQLIRSLMRQPVLTRPAVLLEDDHNPLNELSALGAVVVVLAGEIAGHLPDLGVRERYATALRLADEIAVADRRSWQTAHYSTAPIEALGRWLDFALRYV